MSVELQRRINAIFQKLGERVHELLIVVHPEILNRLRTEDAELLVELERRHEARLTFRSDPAFHHETVKIFNAETNDEIPA